MSDMVFSDGVRIYGKNLSCRGTNANADTCLQHLNGYKRNKHLVAEVFVLSEIQQNKYKDIFLSISCTSSVLKFKYNFLQSELLVCRDIYLFPYSMINVFSNSQNNEPKPTPYWKIKMGFCFLFSVYWYMYECETAYPIHLNIYAEINYSAGALIFELTYV